MRPWGTLIAAACLSAMLGGCATATQQQAAQPDGVVPTRAPSVPATPTPTTKAITCDTAFTADLNAKLAEDGLIFREDSLGIDANALIGTDGLRCGWGIPQTDITVVYANWSRDAASWETVKTDLLIDGYTETDPFTVSRPLTEYDSACSYRDDLVHCVSPSKFIEQVAALQ